MALLMLEVRSIVLGKGYFDLFGILGLSEFRESTDLLGGNGAVFCSIVFIYI